ncbi:hypothetical protein COT75_04730 [Candidatus Beckwithbacteria bacterium CG10_big_fil_rev_8_21_14_0_10_34_10]|uniref:7 transmembrane helices usually fused to an inactive transglutaminase domain-containing protein n=1 Tax=Candidatus Beckwithbacteria bacterium CG10_big_fil_rev_8_21_14_0_10_34_10 TaxID=1974495 RepID=A0A2H0WA23_9BACT|nr:MAG: hypothetical protein COT75_04730 [Candidatus Beckwithbacteria bacterium CG10_big_fil_rev_8_21_14_0_10_34_10]
MKKLIGIFIGLFLLFSFSKFPVLAEKEGEDLISQTATEAAMATTSAETTGEVIEEKEKVEKKEDITESTPEVKGKLEKYLINHSIGSLRVTNFLQHAIRRAVSQGVPANTIVLILLFPLVVALIAGSRHIVGMKGFGIFLPAVLSVAFVATGIFEGLLLFFTIILVAMGARILFRKMKLQYLPRMALLLWFVSLAVFGLMCISPSLNLTAITNISIFPILILILLAESFISIQIGMSMKRALRMSFETLVVALICSFVLQLEFLQKFVILKPEISVLGVALLDIFIGRYAGLRILEYKKFKKLLE